MYSNGGIRMDLGILLLVVSAFSALCLRICCSRLSHPGGAFDSNLVHLSRGIDSLVVTLTVLSSKGCSIRDTFERGREKVRGWPGGEVGRDGSCISRDRTPGMDPALFNVLEFFERSILDIGGCRTVNFDERPFCQVWTRREGTFRAWILFEVILWILNWYRVDGLIEDDKSRGGRGGWIGVKLCVWYFSDGVWKKIKVGEKNVVGILLLRDFV